MDRHVTEYLQSIGRRGGRASKRVLLPEVARAMVKLREARRAFRRFHTQCFWSCAPGYVVTSEDILWVARQLMEHGGREGWKLGAKLCR